MVGEYKQNEDDNISYLRNYYHTARSKSRKTRITWQFYYKSENILTKYSEAKADSNYEIFLFDCPFK